MYKRLFTLFIGLILFSNLEAQDNKPKLVSWQDIEKLSPVPADTTIKYGTDSLQFGELRLPEGKGKFPVVVVVHGGCWQSEYNLNYMAHASEALRKAGFATWTIEFRRIGNEGGGWPGTFLDVAKSTDFLRELAKTYPLDLDNVITLGHSAGGHLALWLAGRKNIIASSEVYVADPLPIKGVVSLAGISDLETYGAAEGSCNKSVYPLMGGTPQEFPERYKAGSPLEMLPFKVPQIMVQGALDPIVPVAQSQSYTDAAKAKKDNVEMLLLDNAGHFDLVAPFSPVWSEIEKAVKSLISKDKPKEIKRKKVKK